MQGLAYWNDAVWLGHGYNSYFQLASNGDLMRGANSSNALNQIVQTLVDSGVIGLIALASFFWVALVATPKRGDTDEFGIRTWVMMLLAFNHSAVYILPLYHFTAFLFGLIGYSLRASLATAIQIRHPGRPLMPTVPPAVPGAAPSYARLERHAD
jgi:O-antigen ligase